MSLKFTYKINITSNDEKEVCIQFEGAEYSFDITKDNNIMFERLGEDGYNSSEEQERFDAINDALEKIVSKIAARENLNIIF